MSRWKTVLGITAVLFAAYIVAAPYITVHQMSSAAENHNGEALSEHVEFPSVRQSIKDQMNAMFVKRMCSGLMISDTNLGEGASHTMLSD